MAEALTAHASNIGMWVQGLTIFERESTHNLELVCNWYNSLILPFKLECV